MNIFDSLVNGIESTRQVVIGARRNLTRSTRDSILRGSKAVLDLATPDLAVTREDREDLETATLCQHQLEELMATLLNQIEA